MTKRRDTAVARFVVSFGLASARTVRDADRRQGWAGRAWLPLAACILAGSGCASMHEHGSVGEPAVLLSYSNLTSDGGMRIRAEVETGTYRLSRALFVYTLTDPAAPAPLAADPKEKGAPLELVRAAGEPADVDRGDREISFTLTRRQLTELGERCIWYQWKVLLQSDSGERVLTSAFYRTSSDEAGVPRAPEVPGPDTSFVLPPSPPR